MRIATGLFEDRCLSRLFLSMRDESLGQSALLATYWTRVRLLASSTEKPMEDIDGSRFASLMEKYRAKSGTTLEPCVSAFFHLSDPEPKHIDPSIY